MPATYSANAMKRNKLIISKLRSRRKRITAMLRTPAAKKSTAAFKCGAAKSILPTFDFHHEKGPINLHQAETFVSLLNDIRNHLLQSKSTRAIFISMAERFFFALRPEVRETFSKPTDYDLYNYISLAWPRFCTFNGRSDARNLIWGYVEKGEFEPNEISILSSIVESAESANGSNCGLSVELHQLVIMVIIFHEMSHAFTKFWFNEIVTPIGVGPKTDAGGESGFLVEQELMGGRLIVEWASRHRFGKMDVIDRVVLVDGSSCWDVDRNTARSVLASLRGMTFTPPRKQEMKIHVRPPGTVRARVTESTENPVPKLNTAPIELGIIQVVRSIHS